MLGRYAVQAHTRSADTVSRKSELWRKNDNVATSGNALVAPTSTLTTQLRRGNHPKSFSHQLQTSHLISSVQIQTQLRSWVQFHSTSFDDDGGILHYQFNLKSRMTCLASTPARSFFFLSSTWSYCVSTKGRTWFWSTETMPYMEFCQHRAISLHSIIPESHCRNKLTKSKTITISD